MAQTPLFGITDSLGNLVSSYSHGMKQKLALIGAFLHKPTLLVLDEPFVGLDPEAAFHLKEIMRELCEQGSAIFFSPHVLDGKHGGGSYPAYNLYAGMLLGHIDPDVPEKLGRPCQPA